MFLAQSDKYRDAINAMKKNIAYMAIELKKNLRKKYYLMDIRQMTFLMNFNF